MQINNISIAIHYVVTCQLHNVEKELLISSLRYSRRRVMLLVKNGEVANHTRVRVDHPKYKVFYKHNVQRPYISFLNNAFMSLQDLLSQSGDTLDEKTTLDLCSIISDREIENENHGEEDDEDENDDVLTSKYKLPEIPNKLKAYRARVKKKMIKFIGLPKV